VIAKVMSSCNNFFSVSGGFFSDSESAFNGGGLTRRARGRLDSHRQNGFFRGFGFYPFWERVSSLQPPVTRAVGQPVIKTD